MSKITNKILVALLVGSIGFCSYVCGYSNGQRRMAEIIKPVVKANQNLIEVGNELCDSYREALTFIKDYTATDKNDEVELRKRRSELESNIEKLEKRKLKIKGLMEKGD